MNGFLTMTEAAEEIGVKRQYVHQLIQSEKVQAVWMLGRWAVPESEVKKIKKARQSKAKNGNGSK